MELLDRLAADSALELEWVDLLSQLEYIGCRKIVKSVSWENVTLETLRHASEEASHAFLLKEAVEKCGLPARSWRDGLLSKAGWAYFQGLDRGVEAIASDRALCYPLVSVAVERRVLRLYPAYLERTRFEDVRKALRFILAQEKRHAQMFDARELSEAQVNRAVELEERLWAGLEAAIAAIPAVRA